MNQNLLIAIVVIFLGGVIGGAVTSFVYKISIMPREIGRAIKEAAKKTAAETRLVYLGRTTDISELPPELYQIRRPQKHVVLVNEKGRYFTIKPLANPGFDELMQHDAEVIDIKSDHSIEYTGRDYH